MNRKEVVNDFFNGGPVLETHNFCVTEDRIQLNPQDISCLVRVAALLPKYVDLAGAIVRSVCLNQTNGLTGDLQNRFRQTLNIGSDLVAVSDESIESAKHPVARADLVRDTEGRFNIVEVEIDKQHGFGYATLARLMAKGEVLGMGLMSKFSSLSKDRNLALIFGPKESFYLLEANYFARKVNINGGKLQVVSETDLIEGVDRVFVLPEGTKPKKGIEVLSMGFPGLSNKAFLGIISNRQKDDILEQFLTTLISHSDLKGLRKFIPQSESLGISKRYFSAVREIINGTEFYVKDISGSGAKGIKTPADPTGQLKLLANSPDRFLLQKQVKSEKRKMNFVDLATSKRGNHQFALRYSLFVDSQGEILDLTVTASPGKIAHGSRQSIFLSPEI